MRASENRLKVLALKNLKPEQHGQTLRDGGGLTGVIKIHQDGGISISFTYQFRAGNKRREKRVGTWPKDDLSSIRQRRDELRALAAQGLDPIEQEHARRAAEETARLETQRELARLAARITYRELFERYCAAHVSTLRSGPEIIRRHEKDVLPVLGNIFADEITRQMVASIGQTAADRGSKRVAHLLLGDIHACFRWGIETAQLEEGQNPAATIKKTRIGATSQMRDRVLSEEELQHLLRIALPRSSLSISAKAGVKIMLATMCRVSELLRARWADIDLAQQRWIIPAESSKNGQAHLIHLSNFAIQAFGELKLNSVHSPWVFPGRTGTTHIGEETLTKQLRDRQNVGKSPLPGRTKDTDSLLLPGGDWTSHDLRRTGATLMGELGVLPFIIDRCQNHVEQNRVTRTYQRQELLVQRKIAFDLLGSKLTELTGVDEKPEVLAL